MYSFWQKLLIGSNLWKFHHLKLQLGLYFTLYNTHGTQRNKYLQIEILLLIQEHLYLSGTQRKTCVPSFLKLFIFLLCFILVLNLMSEPYWELITPAALYNCPGINQKYVPAAECDTLNAFLERLSSYLNNYLTSSSPLWHLSLRLSLSLSLFNPVTGINAAMDKSKLYVSLHSKFTFLHVQIFHFFAFQCSTSRCDNAATRNSAHIHVPVIWTTSLWDLLQQHQYDTAWNKFNVCTVCRNEQCWHVILVSALSLDSSLCLSLNWFLLCSLTDCFSV